MVGRDDREPVTPRKPSVETSVASERTSAAMACRSLAWAICRVGIDLQPVGRIVALGVGVELGIRPSGQRAAQRLLRRHDPRLPVDGGMAAAEHDLRLPIEGAQELALPAVPDARADGADVATVRIISIFSRSCVWTIVASASAVRGSERSRPWAMLDMTRC